MSKRRKKKAQRAPSGYDKHHILFYRKEWDSGYKLKLRRCFVYEIPISIHQELHQVVRAVPALEEDQAKELWIRFQNESELSLFEALEWLMRYSPSAEFSIAIMAQFGFLWNKLGHP